MGGVQTKSIMFIVTFRHNSGRFVPEAEHITATSVVREMTSYGTCPPRGVHRHNSRGGGDTSQVASSSASRIDYRVVYCQALKFCRCHPPAFHLAPFPLYFLLWMWVVELQIEGAGLNAQSVQAHVLMADEKYQRRPTLTCFIFDSVFILRHDRYSFFLFS